MDNMFRNTIIILTIVAVGLTYFFDKTFKTETNPVFPPIDYSMKKNNSIKLNNSETPQTQQESVSSPVESDNKTQPIIDQPPPVSSYPPEVPPVEEREIIICKALVDKCLSCQDPTDTNIRMPCDIFVQGIERSSVYQRLMTNQNFTEYLKVYHPDINIESFGLNDLKNLVRHYASVVGTTPDEAFYYFNIEKDNVISCFTYRDQCL